MKDGIHSLKPFWEKLMLDASSKYGKCSNSSNVLMYMQREFIEVVDSIALDGLTDGSLYRQVKNKVTEVDSSEMVTARKDEKIDLFEDGDYFLEASTGEEKRELVDAKASHNISADDFLEAHSCEVATAEEKDAMRILEEITKDVEKAKENKKIRIEVMRKDLKKKEQMIKEGTPPDNVDRREEIQKEIEMMKAVTEKEPEDNKHMKSRHIANWFVEKLDKVKEYKMLGCNDCNVSFDCSAVVLIPKKTEALKYVAYETTAHMESVFNTCEALLFDQLLPKDKYSLTCWPFELAQFAATSIAHAFHAKHVICGAVDSTFEDQSEFKMPLEIKGVEEVNSDMIVLIIGCHEKHYALLEVDPRKRKVIIQESTKFEKTSNAVEFWMECIVIILKRHFDDKLEEDGSNVLPYGSKAKKGAKNKKKKIWWVKYTVSYYQEGEDKCGAVAFNQLAWRLKELTMLSRQKEELCALIEDPCILQTQNREKAYENVCYLIKSQRKEKIWKKMEGDDDSEEERLTSSDDASEIPSEAEAKDASNVANAMALLNSTIHGEHLTESKEKIRKKLEGNNDGSHVMPGSCQDDSSAVLLPEAQDAREVANAIASLDPTLQVEHSTESNLNVSKDMEGDNGSEEMMMTSAAVSSSMLPKTKDGKKRKRRSYAISLKTKDARDLEEDDLPIVDLLKSRKETHTQVTPKIKASPSKRQLLIQHRSRKASPSKQQIQGRNKIKYKLASKKMRQLHMVGSTKEQTVTKVTPDVTASPSKRRMLIQDKAMPYLMDANQALMESSDDDESKERIETGVRCSAGDFCYNGGDKWVVLNGDGTNGSECSKCQNSFHLVCLFLFQDKVYCLKCYNEFVVSNCSTQTLFQDLFQVEDEAKESVSGAKHTESQLQMFVDNHLMSKGYKITFDQYHQWRKEGNYMTGVKQCLRSSGTRVKKGIDKKSFWIF
jgi:hypothetical protein